MQEKDFEDELARRRDVRARQQALARTANTDDEDDAEKIKFSWSDILALIIASYQIIFPIILVMIAILIGTMLAFRYVFH